MILPNLKGASLISIGQLCDDNCEVHLNKSTLLATKNKEIIMEGIQNPADGLWDIPIQKTILSINNHSLTPLHPGMYKGSATVCSATVPQYKKSVPSKNRVAKQHCHFHELIDENIDWYIMDKQQQTDSKKYLPIKITPDNPSLSVIIHKKKKYMELAQYLHAACLSPVKSSMTKAIKIFFKIMARINTAINS